MARPIDLMGVGVPPLMARAIGTTIVTATAQGATYASANSYGGFGNKILTVTGTNSGSLIGLPTIGGDLGCLLGDSYIVANLLGATITVVATSTTNIIGSGTSVAGNTGVVVATNGVKAFYPLTATSWAYSGLDG